MCSNSPHAILSWFKITYSWHVSDNWQWSFRQEESRLRSLHWNKPLISPHSTFTVDFKGLQHPLCLRALRVQKKTSELYINRRLGLANLNLYPHHEKHAKYGNVDHFKLLHIWLVCNQKTFRDLIICPVPTCYCPLLPLLIVLVDPSWSHQRAAVKPIKRWISTTVYAGR